LSRTLRPSTFIATLVATFIAFNSAAAGSGTDPGPNPDPTPVTSCEDSSAGCTTENVVQVGINCFYVTPCCIRKTFRYNCQGSEEVKYIEHFYTSDEDSECQVYTQNNEPHARCLDEDGNPVTTHPAEKATDPETGV
jgi:hypothetical protein